MELANEMGLPFNSQSTYADLYIDGKYMGNFVIIESVEVGSDRVDIDVDNGSDILLERERDRDETADGMTYLTTSRYGIRFAIGEPEGLASSTTHYQNTLALLNNFETEMNILHKLSEDDIEAVVGKKIAHTIVNAREGNVHIQSGGGGVYGKVSAE